MLKKTLILSLLSLSLSPVQATDLPLFYWDNQAGLVDAKHCEVKTLETSPFRVSQYTGRGKSETENLRNRNGVRQSHLLNGSLLTLENGKGKTGYFSVRVLGVPLLERGREHRWYTSRGDKGFLFEQSLRPVEDYIFLPKNISKSTYTESFQNSQWKVLYGQTYLQVKCPEHQKNREYLIFQVQKENNQKVLKDIAKVGIHFEETSLFSHMLTLERDFEKEDPQRMIDGLLDTHYSMRPQAKPENYKSNEVELPPIKVEQENGTANRVDGLKQVVCTSGTSLNIRDESLDNIIFQAYTGDVVVARQSFENENKEITLNGQKFEFIAVNFPGKEGQDQKLGYAAKNFIMAESDCPFVRKNNVIRGPETTITGLDDEKCCEFPTVKKVTHAYTSGMRMFGARRGGGKRSHAAADLYRFKDEPILAVAPGTVVRDLYFFYQGTYALEVVHSGGFLVRYGEITNKSPQGVRRGATVKMGQNVGYMGVVNSGCCRPMLHFELFKGNKTGSLSQSNRPYNRRSDLMNPTPYLLRWERDKF